MAKCFIPRNWRLGQVIWILLILEFPFTVANLALFGIAAPNTYRTKLWKEGGEHGFNSDPLTIVYAAANYRPVKTPMVWSNFNTQYNLVIGVLSMFIYLTKFTMYITHVFYPILSLLIHLVLTALWAVSIYVQTAPDRIDPDRINNGAPWYITKGCSVSSTDAIKRYCQQAKSAFAVSVVMLAICVFHVIIASWSLWPTKEQRIAHEAKRAEKKAEKEKFAELVDNEMSPEQQWQHMWELQQLPRTPGTATYPMTPRTRAFNALDGGAGGPYGNEVQNSPGPSPIQEEQDYEGKGKGNAY
ncbi:hypothetical protein K469DRAFT_553263 [Zopfia rhizophila CBS 207.26]|uniref:Uncharacterized protein n=1 Tax=Zopfia rhizophila CBS 207.26 TaxID=1314779 RepID=A0A6A6EM85_9PEZI|nr:hypothetical protein K469DRAFT_553263 [Zopfia rhizophila CBS 207.26]